MFNLGSHPINLGLRFILEMTALFSLVLWGWTSYEGWLKYILVIGLPILFALIWGIFAVPNDPSRSGKTVVNTPGWIRLIIEIVLFGTGVWAFYDSGYQVVSLIFAIVILLHYLISSDRIKWLLKN